MNQQERRALRQNHEPRRYFNNKTKLFVALVLVGCAIAASNPSVSIQQVISMESLMMSTASVAAASSLEATTTSTTEPPPTNSGNDDDGQDTTKAIAENNHVATTLPQQQHDDNDDTDEKTRMNHQCAICFFGLPRSYKELVLPSIIKNVLEPNLQYNCDIFVHYYARKKELKGRLNPGGEMDPTEILALQAAVEQVYNNNNKPASASASSNKSPHQPPPAVIFINDTERTFFDSRQTQIDKYLKKRDKKTGKKLYFPWKQKTWKRSSLVNLIRQWHSIDKVFTTMEEYMKNNLPEGGNNKKNYTRVAMLRNDAMYLSPIDIFKLDNDNDENETSNTMVDDVNNQYFVIAPFAQYPVNDRMIYGPYDAIKIWSTQRFDLVEERAQEPNSRGNVMHSESFMKHSIIPKMEALGYQKHTHPGLCFVRTRPDSKVLFNDCRSKGTAKGFETTKATLSAMAPGILGANVTCVPLKAQKGNKANHLAQCSKLQQDVGVDVVD